MISYDKERDYMWNRFKKKMNLLEDMDEIIYISPYWNTLTVKRNSHDDKYNHGYLRFLPADIINRPDVIMGKMERDGDCLLGYQHELFSEDPRSFVMELFLPDWCDSEGYIFADGIKCSNDVSNAYRRHSFNAPKVVQVVDYMIHYLNEDFSDTEFIGLIGADCFYPDIIDVWSKGCELYYRVYDLYMYNKLRRSD